MKDYQEDLSASQTISLSYLYLFVFDFFLLKYQGKNLVEDWIKFFRLIFDLIKSLIGRC